MDEWQETEWESTVSNLINVDIYETVLAAIGENSAFARKLFHTQSHNNMILLLRRLYQNVQNITNYDGFKKDVVFLFSDGSRVSERVLQRKVVQRRKNILVFHSRTRNFYPIKRTRSLETTIAFNNTNLIPQKFILRIIVQRLHLSQDYDRCHYRLCFDKEIKSDGTRYKISCELEYPAQSKYDDICRYEQKLIELSLGFLETCTFDPDPMTYQEMFSCVVPKIQLWNCFNPHDRFKWAYKWNGIKAKMIMRNETDASLWPDANNITSVKCTGDLSKLFGLCLQVEILEDRIVLVEFVAASFGMEIYSVEPNSNVEALESLRVETLDSSLSTNEDIVFGTVGDKPLHIQQFYKSILPTNYDRRKHDGFIIVQQDLIIKWKVPTIDVKCIGQGRYIVGSQSNPIVVIDEYSAAEKNMPKCAVKTTPITSGRKRTKIIAHKVQDDTLGTDVIGGVYELSPDLKILRQRKDRITHSTEKEFRTFLKSVLLMRLSGSDGLRQHHNVMAYSDKE
ncbi:unnamed protein product [Bemisia tabaci]|uniref:Uncharacterized protein n=1 Tax=Bemisia tabaci TaxID=7038 RepID=A0A9P0AF93_BEMTA|nr:unnamed protein product [Bemisia tabaci]